VNGTSRLSLRTDSEYYQDFVVVQSYLGKKERKLVRYQVLPLNITHKIKYTTNLPIIEILHLYLVEVLWNAGNGPEPYA
jgi:hypothetical protein